MRVLLVHPGPLLYTELFLRLEPLGLERVASAVRAAGHEVRMVDLQAEPSKEFDRQLDHLRPEAVGFGLNYLANVPEVLDLASEVKRRRPACFTFAGGHSVSFIAREVPEQSSGGLDAVVRGDQPDRRPAMGRRAVRAGSSVRAVGPGDRPPDRDHPVPRHRDLAHRGA